MTKILYLHYAEFDSDKANLTQVVSMCNAFKVNGTDVHLVLKNPKNVPLNKTFGILKNKYGKLINFNIFLNSSAPTRFNRFGKYFNTGYYKKIIEDVSPDFCFVRSPLMMKACIAAGINYVYEAHNNLLHEGSSILSKYWKCILKKESQHKRFLKLITISQNLKDFWSRQGVQENKIIALHDGFQRDMFEYKIKKNEARRSLNLPINKKIVLYSGSLYPDREVESILELAVELPDILFVVVGGPQKNVDYYKSMAESKVLKNIIFAGRKPHQLIPLYLFAADVLLAIWSEDVPTINFCSPLKVFEYMAAGRTIVAHGFPTIKEVLVGKRNAILVEPGNFPQLVSSTKDALSLPYNNSLAITARKEAIEQYTWTKRANSILNAIQPLI